MEMEDGEMMEMGHEWVMNVMFMSVCRYACVRERERETDRETETERQRQTERERERESFQGSGPIL